MYEFRLDGRTLVAGSIGLASAALLTFAGGVLSGLLLVGSTPSATPETVAAAEPPRSDRFALLRAELEATRPVAGAPVAVAAFVAAGESEAPVRGAPGEAVRRAPAAAQPAAEPPAPRRWVRVASLDWRLIGGDDGYPVAPGLDRAAGEPPTPYGGLIYEAARRQALDPVFLAALVGVESGFDPEAVSPRGARGLMQLMPETAERYGVGEAALHDPRQNLSAGARHLRWLIDRFGGDTDLVLGAYNAGAGAVDCYGGVPPFAETQNFLRRVYAAVDRLAGGQLVRGL